MVVLVDCYWCIFGICHEVWSILIVCFSNHIRVVVGGCHSVWDIASSAWNNLPPDITKDLSSLTIFRHLLDTFDQLFSHWSHQLWLHVAGIVRSAVDIVTQQGLTKNVVHFGMFSVGDFTCFCSCQIFALFRRNSGYTYVKERSGYATYTWTVQHIYLQK